MTTLMQRGFDWSSYEKTAPGVIAALSQLGKAIDESGLEKSLTELIKLRASQMNGCAFCLQFHLNLARKIELPQHKIDLLAAWRDTEIYSARERAALAWTEALTLMSQQHIATEVYAELAASFSPTEIAFLTAAIGAINAWNRIAGALQFAPPFPASSAAR